ncbi:hypothetical protein LTR08_002189 [Meristemomyces frigidus]|nr:hypothetical protein LTR08_002189 [Meristemomyces frigidus]
MEVTGRMALTVHTPPEPSRTNPAYRNLTVKIGAYGRSVEAEADIEALLEIASKIKAKRAADAEAEAEALPKVES